MSTCSRRRPTALAALSLAALLLATAGCGASAKSSTAGTVTSPQGGAACAAEEGGIAITSPSPGAALYAGPFSVIGAVTGAERTLKWRVVDAAEKTVEAGYVYSGENGNRGSFIVPLDLDGGSYVVTVQAGGGSSGPSTTSCLATALSVTVAAEPGEPTWLSGASGWGVADGAFATWRGSSVPMAGAWADNNAGQLALWPLQRGSDYGAWTGNLELAIGAIGGGETWSAAAAGAYDGRWRQSLREMARVWGDRPGRLFIRFAHEFNGDWYAWGVTPETRESFILAWRRFRALQLQEFPTAALVFAPNSETAAGNDLDWRTAFPGREYVDVVAVSYFNAYPWTGTVEDFVQLSLAYDRLGAPRGLQRHLEFARSVGLPFAVSEWGNNARFGDSPTFMQQMNQFFRANAGSGSGQVLYEIVFNVASERGFALTPETDAPLTADTYRQLW